MLENAVVACPDKLWYERTRQPEFWYVAYHIFFLDLYLSESETGFVPPAPFTLAELDPAGLLPQQPYTIKRLAGYLELGASIKR